MPISLKLYKQDNRYMQLNYVGLEKMGQVPLGKHMRLALKRAQKD